MGLAAGGAQMILRQGQPTTLQELLQCGLGILAGVSGIEVGQKGLVEHENRLAGLLEAAIDEDCSEQGLQRVGEN